MPKTPLLHRSFVALGLALLLAGWTACKAAPEQEEPAAKAGVPAPASPGAAASAPAGSPGPAAGQAAPAPAAPPAAPAGEAPVAPKDLPAVVAKVNGQEIRKEILLQGAQVVQIRMAQMGQNTPPTKAFYRQVLNELITLTLLQQEARAQGIVASEKDIDRQIAARKKAFANEQAFAQALAQSGISEEVLRQQARDQLAVQAYVQTQVAPNVTVPEQAARQFYEANKARLHPPERLHLRHILVLVDAKATAADKAKAREKAAGLLKRLQAGEDFATLAKENSDDPGSKATGGDLGWVVRGQTVPSFEQAAFTLTQPNELSPVVESPYGFHVIQLLERQKPGTVSFEQVKDRIQDLLKQQEIQKQVEARARELRAKGKVEVFL